MSGSSLPHADDWVQVAEVAQIWQGELIVGRLREEGIDAQLVDQTFHQEPLTNVRAFAVVRVFVPSAQEEKARRVISESLEIPEDSELKGEDGGIR